MFFAGILAFRIEAWYHHWLHNETAFMIQRRLQNHGLGLMVLPVRVGRTGREERESRESARLLSSSSSGDG